MGMEQIKIWIQAARPKTLTAGIIPILIGTMLASHIVGSISWIPALQTLICSILIQIGINLTNDALDFKKGADNDKRIGFKRVTHLGLLAPKHVLMGGFFCFALALLCGIPLIFNAGWPLLVVLLVSILFGYLYTGGPIPLAYYGLGDIFVFLFFGVVCTVTAYYVQTGFIDFKSFLAGAQIGCLATGMIGINNMRDIECDCIAKKRTLAVLFGKTFARSEISIMTLMPLLLGIYWIQTGYLLAGLLPFILVPKMFQNLKFLWKEDPNPRFNDYFIQSTQIHFLFGLLLIIGLFL